MEPSTRAGPYQQSSSREERRRTAHHSSRIPKCSPSATLSSIAHPSDGRSMGATFGFHKRCIRREPTDPMIHNHGSEKRSSKTAAASDMAGQEEEDFVRLKNFLRHEQMRFNSERSRFVETEQQMMALCKELKQLKWQHREVTDELKMRNDRHVQKLKEFEKRDQQFETLKAELESVRSLYKESIAIQKTNKDNHSGTNSTDSLSSLNSEQQIAKLKADLQSVRSNFQESFAEQITQLATYENRDAEQTKIIEDLSAQLRTAQGKPQSDSSIDLQKKLLTIRADLIESMQQKDAVTMHQLDTARRLVAEKSDECRSMSVALNSKEDELEKLKSVLKHMKAKLKEANTLNVEAEERTSRLMDENERLRDQFNNILACRNLNLQ